MQLRLMGFVTGSICVCVMEFSPGFSDVHRTPEWQAAWVSHTHPKLSEAAALIPKACVGV